MDQDREHLHLLSIFHWIVAVIAAFCSLFPLIHLAIGIGLASERFPDHKNPGFTRAMGWFFILFSCAFILFGLTYAACLAIAGHSLSRHRNRTFCLVMAALSCAFFPFGTALGVFTIIVLSKDSVRTLFDGQSPAVTAP